MTTPTQALAPLADTQDVAEMMHVLGQTVRTAPTTDITEDERVLRARLVLEEALEFVEAMGCTVRIHVNGEDPHTLRDIVTEYDVVSPVVEIDPDRSIDLVEATDALADITVVTKGSAHTLGVDVDEAFRIVHITNMAKAPGGVLIRRPDGKVEKPEGWQPPTEALRAMLLDAGWTP